MNVLIFAGGEIRDYSFYKEYVDRADYIICADRGMEHGRILNITPDIIIGDFDSASEESILFFKNKNVPFLTFPSKKDKTDTEISLEYAIEKRPSHIWIAGGLGSRFDHTLGNVHLLYSALQRNVAATLINEYNQIHLINKEIFISGNENDIVSLVPFTMEVRGVCTEGLYYALSNATLTAGSSYGISNVMTSPKARISIQSGLLLVIQPKDN
ncbi:MAG: thiamine diphosphokinase [Epulopiscium sp.]|nr:thiamine diphosphokinase [Candidatus Epulonipiscium sp.]